MMFDPSDFPYKELTDTLTDVYNPEYLINGTPISESIELPTITSKTLAEVTEEMINSVENQISFHINDSGRHFNIENDFLTTINNTEQNSELYVTQNDNLFNYESPLLDDNTVNQFLLPAKDNNNAENLKMIEGPDLLALHSCVVCHDIFTTEADLLDHTILSHASQPETPVEKSQVLDTCNNRDTSSNATGLDNSLDFEGQWLVCSVCERVLSTALEIEPSEQLCCDDGSGRGSVSSRKLHTMYVCETCSGLFADGDALDRHRLTCFAPEVQDYYGEILDTSRAPEKTTRGPLVCFTCASCYKQYPTAEDLKSHMVQCAKPTPRGRRPHSSTNSNKMWNCGSCNQLFATARELYRHKRGEDRPPGAPLTAYVCEDCDKVLGSMCALHTHKKMHKVSKPGYPCRVCGRRFNQSGHLAIHMRMHTGERPYPCDLCPKAFKVKVERDDHRRTHTGERPFACAVCPKTFTAAARLREHARIHTDQRPYRCDICGAAFRRPYARTVHTLIHTGEKPHECDVCGTSFRRSGDMWKHKRTLHGIQANEAE